MTAPPARPSDEYDLVVIGGGAAGLTAAGMAVHLGARTMLIEARRLGGDCTWTGCVPSKTLLECAKTAHRVRTAERYGVHAETVRVDFPAVMDRVRRVREQIYREDDHPDRFEKIGVDVTRGRARFVDPHRVRVEGPDHERIVRGSKFVVATGSRPATPPIDGLEEVPYRTTESIFELETRPDRLGIVGGGPVGTELGQAFARLGCRVTLLEAREHLLPEGDPELTETLRESLEEEGVHVHTAAPVDRIERDEDGALRLLTKGTGPETVDVDELLVAAGRRPNVEDLGLEEAGIRFDAGGIDVNERCRTSRSHVYASGDVTGRYRLTHMSDHMSKVAVTNALLRWPRTIDGRHVPAVTYTDPELARVGASAAELDAADVSFRTYRFPYAKLDRAVTDGATTGLVKVFARGWDGRILGASVLGRRAGELICEYALAMRNGLTLRNVADTIHPYPSYGLAVRRAADQWYVQKHSPTFVRILQTVFGYRGPVPEHASDEIV